MFGSNIDLKSAAASAITAAAVDKGIYGVNTNATMRDAAAQAGANVAAQAINLGSMLPIPADLTSISHDLGQGLTYLLINQVYPTSPYGDNKIATFFHGFSTSVLSYTVTEKLFQDL